MQEWGKSSLMEITRAATLFRRRCARVPANWKRQGLLSRFSFDESGSAGMSGLQRRVISRHVASLCENRTNALISLSLSPLLPSLYRIDANRHGIDGRPPVKLIHFHRLPRARPRAAKSRGNWKVLPYFFVAHPALDPSYSLFPSEDRYERILFSLVVKSHDPSSPGCPAPLFAFPKVVRQDAHLPSHATGR